jgi:hypothetical protein
MIHRRHRDAARKQGGLVLKKEKVVHDGTNAAKGGPTEGSGTQYLQYRPRQGLFPYKGLLLSGGRFPSLAFRVAMNHEKLLIMSRFQNPVSVERAS